MALIEEPKIMDPEEIERWWWRDIIGWIEGIEGQIYLVQEVGDDQVTLAPVDDPANWERWTTFMLNSDEALEYHEELWEQITPALEGDFGYIVRERNKVPENLIRAVASTLGRNYREYDFEWTLWDNVEMGLERVQPGSVSSSPAAQIIQAPPETVDVSFIKVMMVGGLDNERMPRIIKQAAKRGVWLSPVYTEGKPLPSVLPEGVQLILTLKGKHVTQRQENDAQALAAANGTPAASTRLQILNTALPTIIGRLKIEPVTRKALKSSVEKGPYPGMKDALGKPEIFGADDVSDIFGAPLYGSGDVVMGGEVPDTVPGGWPDDGTVPGTHEGIVSRDDGIALATVAVPLAAILFRR